MTNCDENQQRTCMEPEIFLKDRTEKSKSMAKQEQKKPNILVILGG
jgi:hypothetical protein